MSVALLQMWCGIHGHLRRLELQPGRMFLHCTWCGKDTPGWDVTPADLKFIEKGDA